MYRMLRALSWKVARQVFDEDGTIYTGVQQGLEASPHRGVIGTREERIYHFQEYVNRVCQGATRELPLADLDMTPMPPLGADDTARHAVGTTKWGTATRESGVGSRESEDHPSRGLFSDS